jgi:hypothetical protein
LYPGVIEAGLDPGQVICNGRAFHLLAVESLSPPGLH